MTARQFIKANLNAPNVLTMIRLFLVPVYIVLFALGKKYAALACFLLASLTDLLDGRIARKYNLITDFGKLMDPLADKVMVLTAMVSMAIGNESIPAVVPWAAVIVLFCKELLMVVGSVVLYKKEILVYSILIGKVAQCLFIAGLVAVYFHDWFVRLCVGWPMTLDLLLLWCAMGLTLAALVAYGARSLRTVQKKGAPSDAPQWQKKNG